MKQRVKVAPTCPSYADEKGTIVKRDDDYVLVILDNYKHFNELEFRANELILIDEVFHNVPEIHLRLAVKIEKRFEEVMSGKAVMSELEWLKSLLDGQ